MQLRRTIKRPERYRPDELPAHVSRYMVRSELRPQVTEYNPKLPAAAFPTLPVIPTNPQAHEETTEVPNSQYSQNISQPQTYDEPDLSDEKAQLNYNLAKLNEVSKLTEEEWLMREMESSDEGEPVESDIEKQVTAPSWDNLSQGHQLAIISALTEIWKTPFLVHLPNLLRSIGLDTAQIRRDCINLLQRSVDDRAEAEKIAELQSAVSSKLLEGGPRNSPGLSQGDFRKMVQKHLYNNFTESSRHISTKKELEAARQFANNLGLDPGILSDWVDIGQSIRPQKNRVDSYEGTPQTKSSLHTAFPQLQATEQGTFFDHPSSAIATPSGPSQSTQSPFQLRSNEHSPLAARRRNKRSLEEGPLPVQQRVVLSQPRAPGDTAGSQGSSQPLPRDLERKPLKIKIARRPRVAVMPEPVQRQVSEAAPTCPPDLPADETQAATRHKMARNSRAFDTPIPASGQTPESWRLTHSSPQNIRNSASGTGTGTPSSAQSTPTKQKRGPRGPYNTQRRRQAQLNRATRATAPSPENLMEAIMATSGSVPDLTQLATEALHAINTLETPTLNSEPVKPAKARARKVGEASEGGPVAKKSKTAESQVIVAEQNVETEEAELGAGEEMGETSPNAREGLGRGKSDEVLSKKPTKKSVGRKAKEKQIA